MNGSQMSLSVKSITLSEAKRAMMNKVMEGEDERCPCCTRLVKLYKRKLHAEMVLWLIGLWHLSRRNEWSEYFTTLEILKVSPHLKAGGTNGTLLIHWGLIEKMPEDNRAGAPAGSYKITGKGIEFLRGRRVPARIHLVCGELVGYSNDSIDVKEALGNKFSYGELMGHIPVDPTSPY